MNIKFVQSQLKDLGYYMGEIDGDYGPLSIHAVQSFQKDNHIPVTGVPDPATFDALYKDTLPTSVNLAERAKQYAISKNGVREATGKNDGQDVEMFLASVGLGKGYSWCMAFLYWCYQQASRDLRIANPMIPTGGVMDQYRRNKVMLQTHIPQANDIGIIKLHDDAGHTFIVDSVVPKNNGIITVEGNTNDNGSANGDGVYYPKHRSIDSIFVFLRVQ